jgi:hypothetical protein
VAPRQSGAKKALTIALYSCKGRAAEGTFALSDVHKGFPMLQAPFRLKAALFVCRIGKIEGGNNGSIEDKELSISGSFVCAGAWWLRRVSFKPLRVSVTGVTAQFQFYSKFSPTRDFDIEDDFFCRDDC